MTAEIVSWAWASKRGGRRAANARKPETAKPADDALLRRVVVASLLELSVRQGEPFVATLNAAKSLAPDAAALRPLESFAANGVPTAGVVIESEQGIRSAQTHTLRAVGAAAEHFHLEH